MKERPYSLQQQQERCGGHSPISHEASERVNSANCIKGEVSIGLRSKDWTLTPAPWGLPYMHSCTCAPLVLHLTRAYLALPPFPSYSLKSQKRVNKRT